MRLKPGPSPSTRRRLHHLPFHLLLEIPIRVDLRPDGMVIAGLDVGVLLIGVDAAGFDVVVQLEVTRRSYCLANFARGVA